MAALSIGQSDLPSQTTAQREFRAAWVATVANIDWPTKPGLPTEQQRSELLAIIENAKDLRLNALVLQIRPACDALYDSKLEPWSYYLTGEQGKAPQPRWDPLAFAVEECHKRGIELHTWFNPFRALHPANKSNVADNHVSLAHPSWVKQYGKYLWLDPGDKDAREHSLAVILDVVNRYDIDGIHIDDYFYPYPETDPSTKKAIAFPDEPSWKKYRGDLKRDDWRRQNVDAFIEQMYLRTKKAKPWVKVGISPFGIYRPGFPSTVKSGFDQYSALYADALKWLQNGWCDYFTPQLYWKIDSPQPYEDLLKWWTASNTKGRFMWPGSFTSQVFSSEKDWSPEEIVNQVKISRKVSGSSGHVHFSQKTFRLNPKGINGLLKSGVYSKPAMIPALEWVSKDKPQPPTAVTVKNGMLTWKPAANTKVRFYAVYLKVGMEWLLDSVVGLDTKFHMAPASVGKPQGYGVATLDVYEQQSDIVVAK